MAGQICLVSCLLAICLPIIFVQLPRFETVKGLRAENEAETRSEVLRRRPLSPSRKILRRITRPWSETDIDITSAESEQEHVEPEQIAQANSRGRWDTCIPRSTFGADACADTGASSKEEELSKARAGKKPWDPPFRRQFLRTELVRKSPGGRWHVVTDASPPRKTGRDMEARGVAIRLFPPDPVSEVDDVDEDDRCSLASSGPPQTPQEPLHRRSPPKNKLQLHNNKRSASPREHQSEPPPTQSILQQRTDPEPLPSPLDGSPLPYMCHAPQSAPPTRIKQPPSCHCKHHASDISVPQLQSMPKEIAKEATTCHHTCHCHTLRGTPPVRSREPSKIACEHPDSGPAISQPQSVPPDAPKDVPKKAPKNDAKDAPKEATKDGSKEAVKEGSQFSNKAPKSALPLWQGLLVTMGVIVFVFAFAILVAHCLAWFLVYKTEARLGEVRSGLLRGGEMKLCLCGRG